MDPDAALDELLALTSALSVPPDLDTAGVPLDATEVARIAELVQGLDGWLMIGGFLPGRWAAGRRSR